MWPLPSRSSRCPDAWFVRGGGPQRPEEEAKATAEIPLARAHSRFRAIESRRPVIRCVNRGVSLAIDPAGDLVDEILQNAPGKLPRRVGVANFLIVQPPTTQLRSIYVRVGNLYCLLCLLGIAVLMACAWKGKTLLEPPSGVPAHDGKVGT